MGGEPRSAPKWLEADFRVVARIQRAMGAPRDEKASRPPWHYLFIFGAALGNELFYILFLPALFWLVSRTAGESVISLWCLVYVVGQALKDILRLPRPTRECGVVPLETHYALEFGIPSTHAMAAVSLPFRIAADASVLTETFGETAVWTVAWAWCLTMTASRLYMGVHSLTDVAAGVFLGRLCLSLHALASPAVAESLRAYPVWSAPLCAVGVLCVYLGVTRPRRWTTAPGDTALIIGVWGGVLCGLAMAEAGVQGMGGLPSDGASRSVDDGLASSIVLPLGITVPLGLARPLLGEAASIAGGAAVGGSAGAWVARALGRCVVGYAVLFATRAVVKACAMPVAVAVAPGSKVDPRKRYATELPCKFATYAAVGFNAVLTVPAIHAALGL